MNPHGRAESSRARRSLKGAFYSGVFAKGQLLVLALRGTDDGYDIVADAQIFLGHVPNQLAIATRAYGLAKQMVRAEPN
jgi:hypothetical protein